MSAQSTGTSRLAPFASSEPLLRCKCSLVVDKRTLAKDTIDTRSRVVAAALRCFSRRGFAWTSLAHIESEAGLSPGAGCTYRYFASKGALVEAAVEHAVARADERMRPAPASLKTQPNVICWNG